MGILIYNNQIVDYSSNTAKKNGDMIISTNTTFYSGSSYIYENLTINLNVVLYIQSGAIVTVSNLLTNKGVITNGSNGNGQTGSAGSKDGNGGSGGGGGKSAQTNDLGGLSSYTDQPSNTIYGGGTGGQGYNGGGGGAGGGVYKIIARKIYNTGTFGSGGQSGGDGAMGMSCNDYGGNTWATGAGGGGGGGAIFIFSEEISGGGGWGVAAGLGGNSPGCTNGICRGSYSYACSGAGSAGTNGRIYFAVGNMLVPTSSYPAYPSSIVYTGGGGTVKYINTPGSIFWF